MPILVLSVSREKRGTPTWRLEVANANALTDAVPPSVVVAVR